MNDFAPLICRVVRAVRVRGRWAWIPGGGPPLRSCIQPQNLQFNGHYLKRFSKHSKTVFDGRLPARVNILSKYTICEQEEKSNTLSEANEYCACFTLLMTEELNKPIPRTK